MLESVTWKQFMIFLGVGLVVYYGWVGYVLLKQWLKQSKQLPGGKRRKWQLQPAEDNEEERVLAGVNEAYASDQDTDPEEEADFDELEKLSADIEQVILACQVNPDRILLLAGLRQAIDKYPRLNLPPFRMAINNVIMRRSREHCNITISQTDADQLWKAATI